MTHPLRTQRLELQPASPELAEEAWPLLDDDRLWTYFPELRPPALDDLRRLYQKWQRGSQDPREVWLNWLCRERVSHMLIGSMQATIFVMPRSAYIAYAVYPAHQRKGYAREACAAIIQDLHQKYNVSQIFAQMDARNEPSYRLAESLGFVRVKSIAHEFLYRLTL